jgi:3-deoxy-7-phosphoheptulonate synthase
MGLVQTVDFRITAFDQLLSPASLRQEILVPLAAQETVLRSRQEITRILNGEDDRLALVIGPCSIHDPAAALIYAERLADLASQVADCLLIVMRVYVEKPRTRLGWKGLISDPRLDGSHDLNSGLRLARGLMVEILCTGLPIGCEFLDPAIPGYLSDAVTWGSIGARTVQSQVHRQLSSGLSMPVGIKNSTSGQVEDAVDAILTAARGHVFPGISDHGVAAILTTSGNPDCHVVLRGSSAAPNYGPMEVARTLDLLAAAGLPRRLFIDASHGNSGKDHERQAHVIANVARRIGAGERGIAGLMVESFLAGGRQELVLGRTDGLAFGQSVTDACAGWSQTVQMVEVLTEAIAIRRSSRPTALAG